LDISTTAGQGYVHWIEAAGISDFGHFVPIDDSIIVSLPNRGLSFDGLRFNIKPWFSSGGTFSIVVNGFDGSHVPVNTTLTQDSNGGPLTLNGNGSNNYYSVVASPGDRITSIEIKPDANSSYQQIGIVVISNIVPEPASWLLACLALCFVRRHR
jgi:hypothetical protein